MVLHPLFSLRKKSSQDTISTQMTEVIIDDGLLHPAFFVSGESSKCSVIFSSDGASVLACSQPLARVGEGSVKFAELLFKKFESRQICLICKQDLKSTTLWTARLHLMHCHQMFCDFEELSKHNSKWVKSAVQAWEIAVKKRLDVSQLLGKRPMDIFVTDISASSALSSQQAFRRTFIITTSRGLLPFSFVNSPGEYSYFLYVRYTCLDLLLFYRC